jgi:hypothetical protein
VVWFYQDCIIRLCADPWYPKSYTRNYLPETLYPKPCTRNPILETLYPKSRDPNSADPLCKVDEVCKALGSMTRRTLEAYRLTSPIRQ